MTVSDPDATDADSTAGGLPDPGAPGSPVITTPDGSRTALNVRYGEAYGSRHGAAAQARHVFVEGSGTHRHPHPRVLEIGFGVGLNFRATLANVAGRRADLEGVGLEYLAYEFDPAPAGVLREVAQGGEAEGHPLWLAVLERWPTPPLAAGISHSLEVSADGLRLDVQFADVLGAALPQAWATALYLDGFSPARNPEVWTPGFVARLAAALAPGGVLTTYSAAGHVRRSLAAAGLHVERRPGAPGKRECLRAVRPE